MILPERKVVRKTAKQSKNKSVSSRISKNECGGLKNAICEVLKREVPESEEEIRAMLLEIGVSPTNQNGIAVSMILKALGGDKAAAEWLREASGEKISLKEPADSGGAVVIFVDGEKIAE